MSVRHRVVFCLLFVSIVLAGCGWTHGEQGGAIQASASPVRHDTTRPQQEQRTPQVAQKGHASRRPSSCPSPNRTLSGVYHPSRLQVLDPCRRAAGRVELVRHEPDGDLHIDVALDLSYKNLLAPANYDRQHGDLVVEFMARDGGHLPEPRVGQHIVLRGAWVDDTQHSWNELHPVWAVSLNGAPTRKSGPQFGGSPASDRSYDAADDCRTGTGVRCIGYSSHGGGGTYHKPSPEGSTGGGCEPGYSPCLPRRSDLNCNEIPASKKPVTVTGSDPYRLDADGDGVGCESG
jgi:hypothetical protein